MLVRRHLDGDFDVDGRTALIVNARRRGRPAKVKGALTKQPSEEAEAPRAVPASRLPGSILASTRRSLFKAR